MSTKTMRLPPRRISTPNASSNNNNHHHNPTTNNAKRKERESAPNAPTQSTAAKTLKPSAAPTQAEPPPPPVGSGQLLAGYLAHEFLTKGTLLGQPWTSRSAEDDDDDDPMAFDPSPRREAEPRAEPAQYEKMERYAEVANLLKTDGAQLAGIVNPTQLARFLQL